jgi:hypothetical protein
MHAIILFLALAAVPDGVRGYRVFVGGEEDGAAELSIHPRPDGSLAYAWRSQIGLSRDPCLRSEQRVEGVYHPGDPVPDELALSLGAPRPGATAVLGHDGLPDRVEVGGVVYEAGAPRWNRCWPRGLSDGIGVRLPAGPLEPRRLARAVFSLDGKSRESRRFDGALPEALAVAVAETRRTAGADDCKVVAARLARTLARAGYEARVEGGLLLDRGRLWPHAWTQVKLAGGWRDLDATTSARWADAGRVAVGPLEGPDEWHTALALLSARGASVELERFREE